MAGLGIIIPRSGGPGPVVPTDDAMLNAGSLILIDPAHSTNPWAAGVPANNATVPNIASARVATLLGAASGTQYPSQFKIGGAINDGVKGKVERTGKGALNVIVSQATALASGDGVSLGINADILTFLVANKTHRFYMSQWDSITRVNIGTLPGSAAAESGVVGAGTTAYLGMITAATYATTGGSPALAAATPAQNAVGERFVRLATPLDTSVSSATLFAGPQWGALAGTYNNAVLGTRNNFWPSFAFRRFYLEDLTVSGRTAAQAEAADLALWQAAVASGGRYGSDTMTAASTIA